MGQLPLSRFLSCSGGRAVANTQFHQRERTEDGSAEDDAREDRA